MGCCTMKAASQGNLECVIVHAGKRPINSIARRFSFFVADNISSFRRQIGANRNGCRTFFQTASTNWKPREDNLCRALVGEHVYASWRRKPQGVLEQLSTFSRGLNAAKSLTDTALSSRTGKSRRSQIWNYRQPEPIR